ncbi:O-methyltransferase [Virgibacillus dokdonensis]|uniref:Class I SAM-dependent methyltransferase n=1 Tax=Virgibacillus dokdonensis TaxID=302167 RepID=A0ABU7VJH0_9BACI
MEAVNLKCCKHLDNAINKLAIQLCNKSILEYNKYNSDKFYELYKLLKDSFVIPKTSITKIMSRILFTIGYSKKPQVMVGAGTYTGNALAWLSGYYLLGDSDRNVKIYGLDISSEATKIAKDNFSKVNADNVHLIKEDAINWLENTSENIDLLYIDIDTEEDGKSKYIDLLNVAYHKLNSEGLILAHDINEKKFKDDMIPFVEKILDQSMFKDSINLNVDSFGLSITIKR